MLDQMSKRYSQRPSTIVDLTEPIIAYQFDVAIMSQGISFENKQHEEAKKEPSQPISLAQCAGKMKNGEIPIQD